MRPGATPAGGAPGDAAPPQQPQQQPPQQQAPRQQHQEQPGPDELILRDAFFEVERLLGVRASLEGEDPVVEYRVKWKEEGRADTWWAGASARRGGAPGARA